MGFSRKLCHRQVILVLLGGIFFLLGCGSSGSNEEPVVRLNPEASQPEISHAKQTVQAASSLATRNPTIGPDRTLTPAQSPTASRTLVVVTATSTPETVFAAATWVAEQTEQARAVGTPTPTPPNMIVATFTPRPIVAAYVPTAANKATAEYRALEATAVAITTGTPNPLTPVVTATPTPVMIYLEDLGPGPSPTPTPVLPEVLVDKILFLSDMGGEAKPQAYAMNPDGSRVARLTSQWPYVRAETRDAFSVDGAFRAFARKDDVSDQGSRMQIFVYDYASNLEQQLTFFGSGGASSPAWSPTGNVVAFTSNEGGNVEIWTVEMDNWPAKQLTHSKGTSNHHPSWSPDGQQIVFSSNRSGKQQLWLMDADGSNQRLLSDPAYNAWNPVWVKSPDW